MARQHAGTAVISKGHKEVVNIRIAGAASKCSAGNAIRIRILIRPYSLKPLFGTSLLRTPIHSGTLDRLAFTRWAGMSNVEVGQMKNTVGHFICRS